MAEQLTSTSLASFVSGVLRERPQLFRLICQFNCRLGRDIHLDHTSDTIPASVLEQIQASPRGVKKLSHWVKSHWQLSRDGFWDFTDPVHRFALLPARTLHSLTNYAGAAILAPIIARQIDRATQANCRQALGEELYEFAVKRASFLIRELPASLSPSQLDNDLAEQVSKVGASCLACCFAGGHDELTRRLTLKMPSGFPDLVRRSKTADRPAAAGMLKRILLHEIEPELKSCFN